ncbi:hypothetical protein L0F63_005583, partial [Massospora cicadina]
ENPKPFKTSFYNPYNTKKRARTTPEQLAALETIFQCSPKPAMQVRKELSVKLDMPLRNIQVWFQNRRAKAKSTNCFPQETGTAECIVRNMQALSFKLDPNLPQLDPLAWSATDGSPLEEFTSPYLNLINHYDIPTHPTPFSYPTQPVQYSDLFPYYPPNPYLNLFPNDPMI